MPSSNRLVVVPTPLSLPSEVARIPHVKEKEGVGVPCLAYLDSLSPRNASLIAWLRPTNP